MNDLSVVFTPENEILIQESLSLGVFPSREDLVNEALSQLHGWRLCCLLPSDNRRHSHRASASRIA